MDSGFRFSVSFRFRIPYFRAARQQAGVPAQTTNTNEYKPPKERKDNIIVVPTIEYRRSKIKVLHTTQDIKVSIKLTLFENIPAPLLHTLAEAIVSPTSCLFSVETGFIM